MARMREPYTGTVFEVAPGKVSARLASGWSLLDGEAPEPTEEVADAEPEQPAEAPEPTEEVADAEPEQPAEAPEPTDRPTAESTIAEIRAWAKAHGVALPKKGNKAQLLAAIG